MNNYKWIYKSNEVEPGVFDEISRAVGSEVIAKLLINRGITNHHDVKRFLSPDIASLSSPFVFPDMQKTVDRINSAIQSQETVIIYGDFDSDGVTSTALLYKTLMFLGANVDYYIPDRSEEGHGLNRGALCRLISAKKAKLIITVDCGITNFSEVKLAKSFNTDVIITDHHEPLEEIPEAYTIINPKMLDIKEIKYLAGVGVAYKLAEALLISSDKQYFTEKILPLVAIGTVGDVVPLVDENRILVHKGLEVINAQKALCIKKLMELAGNKPDKKITSTILAFTVVPRINAIGRLADAFNAVEFLVSEEEERVIELANELEKNNKERQHICDETFNHVEQKIFGNEVDLNRDKAIILGDKSWHPGIIGLVASRLVEKYYRPALLFSIDEEKGEVRCSARSVDGLNIFEALLNFSDYFLQFGGHALAAGFSASLDKISFEKLKNMILSHVNSIVPSEALKPELKIDLDIYSKDLNENFIHELDKLAPYGELNPYPVFSMSNLAVKSYNAMGAKKNHLKIMLADDDEKVLEGVWWNKSSLDICPGERVNVAFVPSINNFNGQNRVQMILKDIHPINSTTAEECLFEFTDTETQWLDHRSENGFKMEFLDYLKSKGDNLAVFAESQRALDVLEKIPFLKPYAANRLNINNAECLILLDFPADDETFVNIIKETAPTEVHLFGLLPQFDPVELVKKLSGMFKFAHNEKNGVLSISKAASMLAISNEVLFACAKMLNAAGVAHILRIKGDSLEIRFSGSVNLNTIQSLEEYHEFISELRAFEELKAEYKAMDAALIKETLNNLEAFQCIS